MVMTKDNIKAVILLAGVGRRAWPESLYTPKSLFLIGNKPLLWYSIRNLVEVGVKEFCLVVGFEEDQIKHFVNIRFPHIKVTYIKSEKYLSTHCIYSYFMATPFFKNNNFFRLVGDLIYSKNILNSLIKSQKRIVTAVEKKEKRSPEEFSVRVDKEKGLILKYGEEISGLEAYGEVKGIDFISKRGSIEVADSLVDLINQGKTNYFADFAYQNIINHGGSVHFIDLSNNDFWYEIDTKRDYDFAIKSLESRGLL